MAECRNAICSIISVIVLCTSGAIADEREPVVKLLQPSTYKSKECDCAGCLRGRECIRPEQNADAPGEPVVRSVALIKPASFLAGLTDSCDANGCADGPACQVASPTCDAAGACANAVAHCCDDPACDNDKCCSGGTSCEPTCGASATCGAEPSCGAEACCTAEPSCGAGPSCGAEPSCIADLGCDASPSCGIGTGVGLCEAEIDWSCLNLCSRDGFWLRTEGLLWWTNDDSIPTLATSSPLGTPTADAGILGLPTTTRLFGDSLYGDARFGGRVRFGTWADDCKHGIDGSIWGLLNESDQNVWQSAGDPILARPFNNVDPLVDAPAAQILAEDGVLSGRLRINTSSEIFGGDIGIRKNVWCCADVCGSTSTRLDCVAGYRYFKVREGVRVIEDLESTALVGPTVLGTTINVYDDFQTRNEFNGANIGFVLAQQYKRLTAEFTGRLALGNLSREVMIDGATTVTVPGLAPVTSAGGLLAQPSNIGTYRNDDFAVLPEVQFNMLYNIRRNTRLSLGYTFMYLGDIVRPGDVMDTSVNGTVLDPTVPVTGPDRPQFTFDDSRTWLMGLNFGVEVNF